MLSLIAAYTKNHVIGNKGRIPWKIKGEQIRFQQLTIGNVIIMGRRSYEEIGYPLPDRTTIIVSKTRHFHEKNCITAQSFHEAIKLAGNKKIYISGGASLYREALPFVEKMYITEIELEIEGDTYFPEFDKQLFDKEINQHFDGDIPYTYVTYIKK